METVSKKKLYSTLGTDCKSFYIAIVHDIFLSLKKSRGLKKKGIYMPTSYCLI